jgi:hypothetical protein
MSGISKLSIAMIPMLRGKYLYGYGEPQQTGVTVEIDSIPTYNI